MGALSLAGCGGGDSQEATDAANQAADAATAAQEQVAELQDQVQKQKQAAKKAAKAAAAKAAKKATAVAQAKAKQASAAAAEAAAPEPEPSEPPDVVGLTLTVAESELKSAGFQVDASNNDTMFGIVNPDNYTVCTQDPPRGSIVHVLAQKYGC